MRDVVDEMRDVTRGDCQRADSPALEEVELEKTQQHQAALRSKFWDDAHAPIPTFPDAEFRRRCDEQKSRQHMVRVTPRDDDVHREGMEFLEKLGEVPQLEGVVEFPDDDAPQREP